MGRFPWPNNGHDVLTEHDVSCVVRRTANRAVQLGMLGLVEESHSILAFLAEQTKKTAEPTSRPLTEQIPDTIQFMYEVIPQSPPDGVEKYNQEQLAELQRELNDILPHYPNSVRGVDVVNGNDQDFETLQAWIREMDGEGTAQDATSGYRVRFSAASQRRKGFY